MKLGWMRTAVAILVFAAILAIPVTVWELKKAQELNVAILDKTVPDSSYREHKGLMWLLNNLKYLQSGGKPYVWNTDYFGYFPKTDNKYEVRDLDTSGGYDMVYVTDTYGVYKDDLPGGSQAGNRSDAIYGGLKAADVEQIKQAVYSKGSTFVAEFNTFGSPTGGQARESLYKLLGVRWSGWIGRYFADLTPGGELPPWAVRDYESQEGKPWSFKGPGFLFVDENDRVIVLEEGKESGKKGSRFQLTEQGQAFLGSHLETRYNYWFDIVEADDSKEVLAEYHLDLTDAGVQKLKENGIPSSFPAVVRHDTGMAPAYYFAGDYADNGEVPDFYKMEWLHRLMGLLSWESGKDQQGFYWKAYYPLMKRVLQETSDSRKTRASAPAAEPAHQEDGTYLTARTNQMDLQVFANGKWQNHYVKGVNMGMALPGKWFTDFPKDEATYLHWFNLIGEMNSNTIRVYTLMDPSFYRALKVYNQAHKDKPLWLLQEIWPEESPANANFLGEEYNKSFHKEIGMDLDAIHGNAVIPERQGRAYGTYDSDVSPYVLGFLVGRELEPDEVLATDKLNQGFAYQGNYVSGRSGTATENWLAWSCDYVVDYEQKTYQWQHPVAIVSWPTLDPMSHTAEVPTDGRTPTAPYNDKASVTIQHLAKGAGLKAGLFGAYHIYPNYPDFMNNDAAYNAYKDEAGRLRYGGYLQEFMKTHTGYPALVAEFGLATGTGNAHTSPDGYNHGGMTEEEQGQGIVRMMRAIQREGYAGGLIFEWMDEWAKKTWTNEPVMIPYERHVLWHNAIDPEQNYGILAMEAASSRPSYQTEGSGLIRKVEMKADESYLSIDVTLSRAPDWAKDELLIGLDTLDANRGEMKYKPELPLRSPTGMEFLVDVKGKNDAKLLAAPSYNAANGYYSPKLSEDGRFEEMKRLINSAFSGTDGTKAGVIREEGSVLRYSDTLGVGQYWSMDGNVLHFRLPWGRLNVTDPSALRVLDDPDVLPTASPERDQLKTRITDGIRMSAVWLKAGSGEVLDQLPAASSNTAAAQAQAPFKWKAWEAPVYKERLKASYPYIQQYFKELQ